MKGPRTGGRERTWRDWVKWAVVDPRHHMMRGWAVIVSILATASLVIVIVVAFVVVPLERASCEQGAEETAGRVVEGEYRFPSGCWWHLDDGRTVKPSRHLSHEQEDVISPEAP